MAYDPSLLTSSPLLPPAHSVPSAYHLQLHISLCIWHCSARVPPLPRTSHILMAQSLTFAGLDSVVTFSWRPSKLPYLKITNPSAFHIPYPLSQLYFSPQLLSLSNLLHISLICLIYCLSLPHKIKAPREQRFLSVLFIGESSVP